MWIFHHREYIALDSNDQINLTDNFTEISLVILIELNHDSEGFLKFLVFVKVPSIVWTKLSESIFYVRLFSFTDRTFNPYWQITETKSENREITHRVLRKQNPE